METKVFSLPTKPPRVRWFNFLAHLSSKGFEVDGERHPAAKLIKTINNKKVWVRKPCPHCGSPNGFLFEDLKEDNIILACIRCKMGFIRPRPPKGGNHDQSGGPDQSKRG